MIVHLTSTANLGDFMNSMPVLSGLSKHINEKLDFIIRPDMRKFKGIKEFLQFQDIFKSVNFSDEVFLYGNIINLSSWTRFDRGVSYRPFETCRYENWLIDNYNIKFEVDDDFVLKVPELNIDVGDKYYCGDRWNGPDIDITNGRKTNTLCNLKGVKFLDYNLDVTTNAYLIKKSVKPFISNFTGISVIADLLNKDSVILWTDDMENFDNKPITFSFEKHFYGNRKCKLMYYEDFKLEDLQ
jgi:hypothetical protein